MPQVVATPPALTVRPYAQADRAAVLAVEALSPRPWTPEQFRGVLLRSAFLYVAHAGVGLSGDELLGFVLVEVGPVDSVKLLNLAVRPEARGRGVGTHLLRHVTGKLTHRFRRERVVADVRESNLPLQLWLKARGFRCTRILRDHYADPVPGGDVYALEDGYQMEVRV